MIKKFLKVLPFVFIILLVCSVNALCEEYIFTTSTNFIMPRSSSIEIVNSDHNVYTTQSLDDIQHLIDAGIVEYCEPMSYSELFDYTTEDYYYSEQSNLSQIFTQFAWNRGVFGDTIKVAIIDSGLYNAASDFTFSNITKAADYTSTASSKTAFCNDEIGHGTMVAGIIGAAHNTRGVAGIAPNVELYIFKCFYLNDYGNQTARNSDIINAAYKAIDEYGCDIINLSSGTTNSTIFKDVADYAEDNGVIMVAAVGNSGANSGNTLYYPASYDNVIGVGSTKADGHRANHSQRNDFVDIMAPGENIYSVRISGFEQGTGTSFATPHVTAALALAKSLNPDLTAQELTDALYLTADAMEDRYSGYGSINIQALLTYIKATLSEDLIYSTNDKTAYFAYMMPENYKGYFTTYSDDCLSSVFSVDADTFIKGDTSYLNAFKLFVWDNAGNLSPYKNTINKTEY